MNAKFWPPGIYVRDFRVNRKPAGGMFGELPDPPDPGPPGAKE